MTERDEQRLLTRRERRLLETQQQGGAPETAEVVIDQMPSAPAAEQPYSAPVEPQTAQVVSDSAGEPSAAVPPAEQEAEIEISPFNEDGTPRTRREMRQLREAALAELAAATPQATAEETLPPATDVVAPLADPEPVSETEPLVGHAPTFDPEPVEPTEPAGEDAPVAEADPAEPAPDFDTLVAPPTEPFTIDELREAEQAAQQQVTDATEAPAPEASAAEAQEPEPESTEIPAPVEDVVAEQPKQKRRFWRRERGADQEAEPHTETESVPEPEVTAVAGETALDAEPVDFVAAPAPAEEQTPAPEAEESPVEVAPILEEIPEILPDVSELPAAAEAVEHDDDVQTDAGAKEKIEYSFPDIQPPEEWRSVFDESREPVPSTDGEDFDDLISRAVAQEGAAGTTNTSALIMPTHPEDTGGLTGPLGSTGELFVTGSIELSRSLAETGGHSELHDSIGMEPISGVDAPELTDPQITAGGPAPVAAKSAVSARVPSDLPVVAEPTKEGSKLPLILTITGGTLLAAVAGLGIWGFSNGMFG